MIYLNTFLIMVAWVLVLDQFHFLDEITTFISRWLSGGKIVKPLSLKPLTCSLCMSFWTNLIYILVVGEFSILTLLYILFLSYLTPIVNQLLTLLKGMITKLLNWIGGKII